MNRTLPYTHGVTENGAASCGDGMRSRLVEIYTGLSALTAYLPHLRLCL